MSLSHEPLTQKIEKQVVVKIPFEDYNNEKYNPPLTKAAFAKIVEAGRKIRGEIKDLGQSYFLPGKDLQFKSKSNQHYENSAPPNYYRPLYLWSPQAAIRTISGQILDAGQAFYNVYDRKNVPYQLPLVQNNFVFKNIKPQNQPHRTISKQKISSHGRIAYQQNINSYPINQYTHYHNFEEQGFSRNYYSAQRPIDTRNRYYHNGYYGKQLNLSPLQVPNADAVYYLQPKDNRKIIPVAAKAIKSPTSVNPIRNTVEISNNSEKKTLSSIEKGSRSGKSLIVASGADSIAKKTITKIENQSIISETQKSLVSAAIEPLVKSTPKNKPDLKNQENFVNQETQVKNVTTLPELAKNLENPKSESEHSQIAHQEFKTSEKQTLTTYKKTLIVPQEPNISGKQTSTPNQGHLAREGPNISGKQSSTPNQGQLARQGPSSSGKQTITLNQEIQLPRQESNISRKQILTSNQEEQISRQEPKNSGKQTSTSKQGQLARQGPSSSGKQTITLNQEGQISRQEPNNSVKQTLISDEEGNLKISLPGKLVQRLKIVRGGTAIVGPQGVATASDGGTAIVGPDGVAYIKPNAVAIVGPGSRVILIPVDLDFNRLINQLSKRYASQQTDMSGLSGEYVLDNDGSTIKQVFLPTGGKIVASGPIIYHDRPQPETETFFASYRRDLGLSRLLNADPNLTQRKTPAKPQILNQSVKTNESKHSVRNTQLISKRPKVNQNMERYSRQTDDSNVDNLIFSPPQLISPVRQVYKQQSANTKLPARIISFQPGTGVVVNIRRPENSRYRAVYFLNARGESLVTFVPDAEEKPTPKRNLLILKPVAMSTTEEKGVSVSNPIGHALVQKGREVDIVFQPKAEAVAGPGGIAHAQSDLLVDYFE